MFDEAKENWGIERAQLRSLLTDEEWAAAERTTINAHYTDPRFVRQMWRTLVQLGFDGGRVLEPGSGLGTFVGMAPDTASMTGVELDPLTASISRLLYPHAEVRTESFADTRLPAGTFDATIGNVPFADVRLHDAVHNASGHSMHNHFILKSLALTRPGGLVVVLTSHYTLDARNPAARREMNRMADLIGALRLPSGAHRRAAGTEAVTDLLVFRRREAQQEPVSDVWETVIPVRLGQTLAKVNAYFHYRPDHVLGQMSVGVGMFGSETLQVTGNLDTLEEDLARALDGIVASGRERGLVMAAPTPRQEERRAAYIPAPAELWDGSIVAGSDGGFQTVAAGVLEPLPVPRSAAAELRALLSLRDATTRLLTLEAETIEDTQEVSTARSWLAQRHRSYAARYGPLNRYTLRRTGRTDENGDDTFARTMPTPLRILRADPFGPLVFALEVFDDETQRATPAALLFHRVVAPRPEVLGVEGPSDAVAVSLDRTGGIDLPLIAELLGVDEAEARAAMTGLAFNDPETGMLTYAPEYLSGEVRHKLDVARAATKADRAFQANVDALAAIQPADLGIEDITPKLGAVWISAEAHQEFLRQILKARDVRVENAMPGMWEVRGGRQGILSTSEWGTARRPAPDIAAAVMEQRTLLVYDDYEDADGRTRRVLNPTETAAAQEKAEALQARFAEWVWEDSERARQLVAEYNIRFNNLVLRDYTAAGDYLTLPGMAASFTPRPHQRSAVARMIAEPSAGLFHDVGAGKTAEMIMGAMEMRRMGLIAKPLIVVPNHMRDQFAREWLQIYPRARILAASSDDLTGDRRRLFIAKAASGDWDGIILTQGAFAKIPLSPETEASYVRARVDELKRVLAQADGEDRISVKRIQRKLLQAEESLKKRLDKPKDAGLSFEATGIDYLIVDEMHMYKNLATESNIPGAGIDGSDRATDLEMKLSYLRSTGRTRVLTGATATPIANSVTEAYIMQRYTHISETQPDTQTTFEPT